MRFASLFNQLGAAPQSACTTGQTRNNSENRFINRAAT